jgi:hypothetical protein
MSKLTERAKAGLKNVSKERAADGFFCVSYVICRLLADDRVNELTPREIIAGASDRLNVLTDALERPVRDSDLEEFREEHAILSKHVCEANKKLTASPEASKTKGLTKTDTTALVSTLEISNEELRRRSEKLRTELFELKTTSSETIRKLNARIAELESGEAIKKALQDLAQSKQTLEIADRNVSLLESMCQFRGIDMTRAVPAVQDNSLLQEPRRVGTAVIRQLVKNGKGIPEHEQIIQTAAPRHQRNGSL